MYRGRMVMSKQASRSGACRSPEFIRQAKQDAHRKERRCVREHLNRMQEIPVLMPHLYLTEREID